jgi:hypothetical protein
MKLALRTINELLSMAKRKSLLTDELKSFTISLIHKDCQPKLAFK